MVMRARMLVLALWACAAVLGLFAAPALNSLLTSPLTVPNTESASANQILQRHFGENIAGTFTVVVRAPKDSPRQLAGIEANIRDAARELPHGTVLAEELLLGTIYADINTSMDLSIAADKTVFVRNALRAHGVAGALVTGPPALQHDLTPILHSDLRNGELFASVLAVLLLILVLGLCWAVAVPLLVAAITIAVDIGAVFLLAHVVDMVLYIPNVIELIGLGLAIDYSLLIVHRFRQELEDPNASVDDAVMTTMLSAGRTVVLSSGIVAVGLIILCAVPVPFLRSLGAGGVIVPVVAMLSALTLQPALLTMLGRKGAQSVGFKGLMRGNFRAGRWERFARYVIARPRRVLAGALMVLTLCAAPLGWLELTPGSTTAIPQHLESARALSVLSARFSPGLVSPIQIAIDLGRAHAATSPTNERAARDLYSRITSDHEVYGGAYGNNPSFVDSSGRYEQMLIIGRSEIGAGASRQLVDRIRNRYVVHSHFSSGASVYVGGGPAQGVDFLNSVYDSFFWVVFAALVMALVILARAFRSLVLAVISIVLNLVSVAAALGLLVLFTRWGWGAALLGTYQLSQIEGWVPVFVFAVLFGLSMDYEVFLVVRMRELHDAGATDAESVVGGVARTGAVVTAAAVILVSAVAGFIFGHVAGLQELGIALGLGILLDATIVRALVLPSVMALLGRWCWWMPSGVAKLLRTKAAPLEERGARLER
jgi:RND superfamily putative drug exporter